MRIKLVSWNDTNINDNNPFQSYLPVGQVANLSRTPVLINRVNEDPFLSTVVKTVNPLVIGVNIKANINDNRELLKQYFFNDLLKHNLVVYNEDDSDKQYYKTGIPIQLRSQGDDKPNSFWIIIQTEHQYWQLVTSSSDARVVGSSGSDSFEFDITNGGNIDVPPILQFTVNTTKSGGYQYRRFISIYNNMDKSFAIPLDITNGGLDVQSLIDANKMQSNGNDFRVWQDGTFEDRWLYGMDSDSDPAKAWINFNMQARHEGITSVTFDSDDTSILFVQNRASLSFLRSLKLLTNKSLMIESEMISYSDSDIDLFNYQIDNIARSQKDTVAVSHPSSSVVRHIEHDLWLLYGDSDATVPDTDDDYKPLFDLSSLNSAWSYTNYFDTTANRPGAWKGEILSSKTGLSYTFTDSDPTVDVNPSTRLGLAMIGGPDFSTQYESGTLDWIFSHPCGITQVVYSGESYNTGSWPARIGLQYFQPISSIWQTAQQESEPSVTLSWESFGPHTVSLGATYETIRHVIDGQLDALLNEMAMVQFYGHTISFDSDNLPTISIGTETSINFFDVKLTNSTTGQFIKFQCPCLVSELFTIDCEKKQAYLPDGTRVNVLLSTDRDNWFDLVPGVNHFIYSDTGTVDVSLTVIHRDRIL